MARCIFFGGGGACKGDRTLEPVKCNLLQRLSRRFLRGRTRTRIVSLLVSLFPDDVTSFLIKHLRHEQRPEKPEVKLSSYQVQATIIMISCWTRMSFFVCVRHNDLRKSIASMLGVQDMTTVTLTRFILVYPIRFANLPLFEHRTKVSPSFVSRASAGVRRATEEQFHAPVFVSRIYSCIGFFTCGSIWV